MASGASVGSFAGGFGKALAGILVHDRNAKRQEAQQDEEMRMRADMATLPFMIQIGQDTGNWTLAEETAVRINPGLKDKLKKGSPFQALGYLLGGNRTGAAPQQTGPGDTASDGTPAMLDAQPPLQNQSAIQPATPPAPGSTFLGTAMPTPEQKGQRDIDLQTALAHRAYQAIKEKDPNSTIRIEDILSSPKFQLLAQQTTRQAPLPTAASEDAAELDLWIKEQVKNGIPVTADTIGKKRGEISQRRNAPTAAPKPSDFDEGLSRYMASIGKAGQPASTQDEMAYRKSVSESQRAPAQGGADEDVVALAQMAARQPSIMQSQGMTPTQRQAILKEFAKNPDLEYEFNENRMAPARAQAVEALAAMKELVNIDETTGKVTGLTPGAAGIYGSGILGRLSRFKPGTAEANAKAALDLVTSAKTLSVLSDLKQNSPTGATGFGQLNLQELFILESASSVLKGEISETLALKHLTTLAEKYQKMLQPSARRQPTATGAPQSDRGGAATGNITLDTPIFIGPDGRPQLGPQ